MQNSIARDNSTSNAAPIHTQPCLQLSSSSIHCFHLRLIDQPTYFTMPADTRKTKKGKDGEEEMTVVVPPSKKQAKKPEGDVEMEDAEPTEPEVDPVAQTISGT